MLALKSMINYNKCIYVGIYIPDLPTAHATLTSLNKELRDASIRASCGSLWSDATHFGAMKE